MNRRHPDILTGVILDDTFELGLDELCRISCASEEFVTALVLEGAIEPTGKDRSHWRFSGSSVWRTRVAIRLYRDLEINLPGVALALDLLEEIETLRR